MGLAGVRDFVMKDERRDILQIFFFFQWLPRTTTNHPDIPHFCSPKKTRKRTLLTPHSSLALMNEIYHPCLMRDEETRGAALTRNSRQRREEPPPPPHRVDPPTHAVQAPPPSAPRRPAGSRWLGNGSLFKSFMSTPRKERHAESERRGTGGRGGGGCSSRTP